MYIQTSRCLNCKLGFGKQMLNYQFGSALIIRKKNQATQKNRINKQNGKTMQDFFVLNCDAVRSR